MTEQHPRMEMPEILTYAPHRPPMVWVNEVKHYDASNGECVVKVDSKAHYMGPRGLRASSCLEFLAQAYGFCGICYTVKVAVPDATPLTRAFLASFGDVQFAKREQLESVGDGDLLTVTVSGARKMGPITMFTGHVRRGETVLCSAKMKVFSEYGRRGSLPQT